MPWCRACRSHHVAPMLWRYATVVAGARLDARAPLHEDRSGPDAGGERGRPPLPRVLRAGDARGFAEWAGLAASHARRLWDAAADDLAEVRVGRAAGWLVREDVAALDSPPAATGIRLLPPGDPYLQAPNRPLLAPDRELRARLFRPVASPGAVLADGRLGACGGSGRRAGRPS